MNALDELNEVLDASDLAEDATLVRKGGATYPLRVLPSYGGATGTAQGQTVDDDAISLSFVPPADVQVSPGADTVTFGGAAYNIRRSRPHAWRRVLADLEGPL